MSLNHYICPFKTQIHARKEEQRIRTRNRRTGHISIDHFSASGTGYLDGFIKEPTNLSGFYYWQSDNYWPS